MSADRISSPHRRLYDCLTDIFAKPEYDFLGRLVRPKVETITGRPWELRVRLVGRAAVVETTGLHLSEDATLLLARRGDAPEPPIVAAFKITDRPELLPHTTYIFTPDRGVRIGDHGLIELQEPAYEKMHQLVTSGVPTEFTPADRYFVPNDFGIA
jgi:hypothetical protein